MSNTDPVQPTPSSSSASSTSYLRAINASVSGRQIAIVLGIVTGVVGPVVVFLMTMYGGFLSTTREDAAEAAQECVDDRTQTREDHLGDLTRERELCRERLDERKEATLACQNLLETALERPIEVTISPPD
jgi:hypothetical protein